MSERFSTGQVLTAASGVLLCEVGDLYKVLNFLTGDNLFTHQLPRAFRECQPHVLQQHPKLATIDFTNVNSDNYREFLMARIEELGPTMELDPIPVGEHEHINPIIEAQEMVGEHRVTVIDPDAEPSSLN